MKKLIISRHACENLDEGERRGGGSKNSFKNDKNGHRNPPFPLETGKNYSLNAVGNIFWKRACFRYNLILVWCNKVFRQPRERCMFFSSSTYWLTYILNACSYLHVSIAAIYRKPPNLYYLQEINILHAF